MNINSVFVDLNKSAFVIFSICDFGILSFSLVCCTSDEACKQQLAMFIEWNKATKNKARRTLLTAQAEPCEVITALEKDSKSQWNVNVR